MSPGTSPEVKLEIGHVLFIDIVGYSQLLITQQSEQIETLRRIVRGTTQFRAAEAEGKLLRLPTGDGGALVFRTTPETPVLCAIEIARELKKHPELSVRMGIHSGPVNPITDLNEQANVAGAGINIAQRVMDCGDAGHILLSRHVAEDLEHFPRWQPYLHELGECGVKHGARVHVFNLYTEDLGNPEVPEKLRLAKADTASAASDASAGREEGFWVAVLPFKYAGANADLSALAEGLSEDIVTGLSRFSYLSVIARSSTAPFVRDSGDVRAIGKKLGAHYVMEGSVRQAGSILRITVQLVDTISGAHLWAESYDRVFQPEKIFTLDDVVPRIVSTVADMHGVLLHTMAEALRGKTPESLTPYEAVLRSFGYIAHLSVEEHATVRACLELAVERAPANADVLAMLSNVYAEEYKQGFNVIPEHLSARSMLRGGRWAPHPPVRSVIICSRRHTFSGASSKHFATRPNALSRSIQWMHTTLLSWAYCWRTLVSGSAAARLPAARWSLIPVIRVGIASLNSIMLTERRTIAERST